MGTTAAQKKLFFNLRQFKNSMQVVEDSELSAQQVRRIAKALDVPERDVITMNLRLSGRDHSLNAPIGFEVNGERQDWLVGETVSPEADFADREELANRRALLSEAFAILDKRERHILTERRLKYKPTTLLVLSLHYGISPERVRQIEGCALAKLQKEVRAQV
jgi:RNA polymerase sigma-32 factor